MSCKCGATVKAGECAVGITRFQVNEIHPFRAMRARLAQYAPVEREPAAETATSAYWRNTGQEVAPPRFVRTAGGSRWAGTASCPATMNRARRGAETTSVARTRWYAYRGSAGTPVPECSDNGRPPVRPAGSGPGTIADR